MTENENSFLRVSEKWFPKAVWVKIWSCFIWSKLSDSIPVFCFKILFDQSKTAVNSKSMQTTGLVSFNANAWTYNLFRSRVCEIAIFYILRWNQGHVKVQGLQGNE